jgi:two-component system, cell cycle sensor histidine kinase and response regulator CckA
MAMATILVVDDLAANREVLVSLLQYKGHVLLEAENGSEAYAMVQARRPDLVITDVLMPVMDGYELVRQLRLDPTTRNIPVVFYTAHYGESEARKLALSSGVADVLTKPVEPEAVLELVGRLLSGSVEPNPAHALPLTADFDRAHLRLLTDKLSDKARDLGEANARLRALINIGLELASEKDPDRLLRHVCVAARDLFGATYVTLGILDRADGTLQRFVTDGTKATDWIAIGGAMPKALTAVVAERRMVRGENAGGDPVMLGLPELHPEIWSYLIAPVASPTYVYGWICLVGNEGRKFGEDDEPLVMALAGQIGRTYENGYYHAVSERERARAQRYLDTAQVILLALDLDGRIKQVNNYACSLLGFSVDTLLGRDWIDTCTPARIRGRLREQFRDLTKGYEAIVENPILTRSGEERLIEWRNTLLRDPDGNVTGTFSSGTDITERNRAIDALRTAEERMRFALQSANVGIWDMDYVTGALRWSDTLEAQYGLLPGTFGGTFDAFIERIHPDDRSSVLEGVGKAMKAGADFTVHNRAVWPDGTTRWLSGAGRILLDAGGKPVRGVGISLDVTERQILEAQYQQAQKMEAVGRLAGGVAHDFNNLLTAILGYCELLLTEVAPNDPRHADITEIEKAGNRAAGLTRQLLAFSRKQIIEPTSLNLSEIVTDMQPMLERLIGEDVRVKLSVEPNLPPVRADRGQVEQIVMNLAVNARDAMPRGGTLTIETANIELDEHYVATHLGVAPGPHVALIVTDTGTGMTPEVQRRLFEPFFTTKEVGKGTGLGLATVHGIVARSGGSVGVYSEVGRGTSLKVYFPLAQAEDLSPESRPADARHRTGTETVLVVEDEIGLRELTKRLLERHGYRVLLAANAEEAYRLFDQDASIDVLLTDVVMPGASGPELTRALRDRRPSLRVIYMSGYTEEAIVHHGVLAPGVAFLHKPFTSEMLGRKIRDLLER